MGTVNNNQKKYPIKNSDDIRSVQENCEQSAQDNKPLYHYTSLDNLKSILKSKRIHFTSLKKTNDLQELIDCKGNNQNNLYVLSATWDEKESIALWNIYSKQFEKGIRIKFSSESVNNMIRSARNAVCYTFDSNRDYVKAGTVKSIKLLDVSYTNRKRHNPSFYSRRRLSLNIYEISGWESNIVAGYFKDDGWDYERERRILVEIDPLIVDKPIDFIAIDCNELFSELSIKCSPCMEKEEVLMAIKPSKSETIDALSHKPIFINKSKYQWKVFFKEKCSNCNKRNTGGCKLLYNRNT